MGCGDCIQKAEEVNRSMTNLLIVAKQKAIEDKRPKAICMDEVSGLFIADAQTAFTERFFIKQVVTGLH